MNSSIILASKPKIKQNLATSIYFIYTVYKELVQSSTVFPFPFCGEPNGPNIYKKQNLSVVTIMLL